MIEFDGVRSTALGVFVEKYPPRPIPKRKHEKFSVPGRNGDVIVYEDAWENIVQPYDIYLSAEKPGLPLVAANEFGRARIEFDCQPQRFLKSGYTARSMAQGQVLRNPTGYTAKPVITVYGRGSGTLTIGGRTLTISVITDGMTLDCAEEEAYFYSSAVFNLNTAVTGNYPRLGAGDSAIGWTGGITAISLAPRWYEL